MKRLFLIGVFCVFAVAPARAGPTNGAGWDGGTASWTRVYYQGQGGEFTLYPSPTWSLSNSEYAPSTSGKGGNSQSFETFCVETDEFVDSDMGIWVSEAFVDTTQPGSHAWQGGSNTNSGDNLDGMTAYLYTQFATGILSGYAYTGTVGGLNRSQTAGALQRTIWYIEDEIDDLTSKFMGVELTTAQVTLAQAWLAEAEAANWGDDIGNVRVLQLYRSDTCTKVKQDQLFLTPVPGALLLGFLGLGVAGLKLRKFA